MNVVDSLFADGRQGCGHGGKLCEHLCPANLGTLKRLLAKRHGDVEP